MLGVHENSVLVPRRPCRATRGTRCREQRDRSRTGRGDRVLRLGPGALVTAAFVGPGTVATCTVAGATHGYTLLWALAFSLGATLVLQDMAARLGAGARLGLGEALVRRTDHPWWARGLLAGLILLALVVGNGAYEAGNLAGAALGLEALWGRPISTSSTVLIVVAAATVMFIAGGLRRLQSLLVWLVLCMSVLFSVVFVATGPNLSRIAQGLMPGVSSETLTLTLALIGTTVVPYNLFLHAAAARHHRFEGGVTEARREAALSVGLGGLVSLSILGTAAQLFQHESASVADLIASLESTFGGWARVVVGGGLFAAGLTSSLTAPMAGALVAGELLSDESGPVGLKAVGLMILGAGAAVAVSGFDLMFVIVAAQAANGVLLPLVVGFLVMTMNRRNLLGRAANGWVSNLLGVFAFAVSLGLGIRLMAKALGV
ncbi:MAG: NRAMP family divalent metal transporter [Myxococcota bacterium]